jgi:hypothetical protein
MRIDLRATARDVAGSMSSAALDVVAGAKDVAGSAAGLGRTGTQRLRVATGNTLAALPAGTVPELAKSVDRLRTVRTPKQAVAAFETETEHLLTVIAPLLVERPLPVRRTSSAKAIVACAGGLAAAGDELEELAALVSYGATLPPSLPVMIGANLAALAVEVYVASSLRVHDLRDAGFHPDPHEVARDVIFAMTGKASGAGGATRHVTKQMVHGIALRVLSRWGAAFVPVVGIAYSGWDAQRTVDAVRALPMPAFSGSRDAHLALT